MEMHFNWLAYGAAVVAQMVIGFLWFHPSVMGGMWAKSLGITTDQLKPKNPGMVYGLTIVYTLLFTMFLMVNVTGPGQNHDATGHSFATFQHGVFHAITLTVLIIFPVLGTPAIFEGKPKGWMIVQVGYWCVRMIVAMGILSAWR